MEKLFPGHPYGSQNTLGAPDQLKRPSLVRILQIIDMILDNSIAGLINLDLVQAQKVREAGSYPLLLNEAGAQFLWGVPREGQTVDDVAILLCSTLDRVARGDFGNWLIPAVVADFENPLDAPLQEPPPPPSPPIVRVGGSLLAFVHKDMEQALVWIERDTALTPADRPKAALFNTWFDGGMRGVAFQELREARGLACQATGGIRYPQGRSDPALVFGRIGCQADKTGDALAAFLRLFQSPPTAGTRLAAAREGLLSQYRSDKTGFRSILPTLDAAVVEWTPSALFQR